MQSRNQDNYLGIDIANYQAGLDFTEVKAAGIKIVYIKATEGRKYVNPYVQQHYQKAKEQGLFVGFYHYFRQDMDPMEQAIHFCNTIASMPYDCHPVLDVEDAMGSSPQVVSASAHAALNEIAYLTKNVPAIYTYTSFARDNLIAELVNMYPVWMADYNSRGVPGDNQIWDTWVGYQYSSEGNIGGITVDMDEFTDDILIKKEDNVVLDMKETGDNPTDWAIKSTTWAKSKEIANGDGAGNYGWQQPITREAAITFLHNFAIAYGLEKEEV